MQRFFLSDQWIEEEYDPTIDHGRKRLEIDGKPVVLEVWETHISEYSEKLETQWTRECDAVVFCVSPDVSSAYDSFIVKFMRTLEIKNAESCDLAIVVAANKLDLQYDKALVTMLEERSINYGTDIIFNSCKDSTNVVKVFEHLVREWRKPKGKRGGWPWSVGVRNYRKLYHVLISYFERLNFSNNLIEDLLSFALPKEFVQRVCSMPPERKCCSVM